ncbi:MAG: TonB-dependent receptor plug domain-containing protein, partial [Vicinamibacterales bacterium]
AYEVPNTAPQDTTGQDQRQANTQVFAHFSWQRAWSARVVSQASFYARRSGVELVGSARDTPLFADANRSLVRLGGIASLTMQRVNHLLKVGAEAQRLRLEEAFSFYVTDEDEAEEAGFSDAASAFDRHDPFEFTGEATPRLVSLFVQDEWQASSRLTLSAGLRFDRSTMLLRRHQWSPRLGAAFRLGPTTVVRGSASRFFQPPQPENLLLSSSEAARVLSPFVEETTGGGAGVEPERQWGMEAGVEQWIRRRVRLDAAYWHRTVDEVADPNVFAGTTIIFPNAVASGRARGMDLRLEVPKQHGWSAYANVTVGRVVQQGPITGGLFLEDEIGEIGDGEEFVPDHDQRYVLGGGFSWAHEASAITLSLAARSESGTPIQREEEEEAELAERPGAELVDFDRGRVKPRTLFSLVADVPVWRAGTRSVRVRTSALNLFDQAYAYNFGNPFSGTHFGAPRSFSVSIRAEF